MKYIAVIILLSSMLTSCASCRGTTLYGWGRYKDSEVEIESKFPLSDLFNFKLFGVN